MMAELNSALSQSDSSHLDPAEVTAGLFCCARSSVDDRWYRVTVVPPGSNEDVDSCSVSYSNSSLTWLGSAVHTGISFFLYFWPYY